MTRGTLRILLAALALVAPSTTDAQAPLALTLEDAIQRARNAAPRLTETRAREVAANAVVAGRAGLARPVITGMSGILRTNHVDEFGVPQANGSVRIIFPDIPSNYRARAEVSMPLVTSGRLGALVTAAEAERDATRADLHSAVADVTLEVSVAYWTLVTARERAAVVARTIERADAVLADVRSRVDAGLLPPNDFLSAQAQRARQSVQLVEARNAAALAELDLARLIGVALDQSISPTTPLDRPTAGVEGLTGAAPAVLAARATETRPERQGLLLRQTGFRASAEAALAATRPQVAALAAVEPARPNARFVPRTDEWKTSWDVGVNVTWTVFDGGRARADRVAAMAQADALQARVKDFDARVAVEVRQRLLELESAHAALAASNEAVAAATEARRVVGERFAVGVATSTEVLDADVAALDAELERTRLTALLRINEARLIRTVGAGS